MFTQSMYFRVSVIQNEVRDLANVSCEVPARDPSHTFRMTRSFGQTAILSPYYLWSLTGLFMNICVNINSIANLFLNINTHERPINFRE